jgi:hypothetical protein
MNSNRIILFKKFNKGLKRKFDTTSTKDDDLVITIDDGKSKT